MKNIATQLVLYLCEAAERKQGSWVGMRWWKQAGIDLAGSRLTAEAASEVEEDRLEEQSGGGIIRRDGTPGSWGNRNGYKLSHLT